MSFFLSSREPPADLLKKKMKKRNLFLGPNRQTHKRKTQRERDEKKSAQIPKKAAFFVKAARQRGPVPFLISTKVPSLSLSLSLSEGR